MKFIIREDKLDSIIDSYITKQFDNLEYVKDGKRDLWVGPDRKPVIIIIKDNNYSSIYVLDIIYASTYYMFSMGTFKNIQHHLLKWFDEHMGIKSDEVSTFDNEGVDYIY